MTDDPRRAQLRRMKAIALAMLLAMLAGFVLSHAMGNQGAWAWVSAFCEAATVGALADWFAVVALFRHPLGLPIPHTAIIPRNKDRIGDTLAAFLRDNFLTPQVMRSRIKIHPLLILLSMLGGLGLFGAMGLFFGPIILSVTLALVEIYKKEFRIAVERINE